MPSVQPYATDGEATGALVGKRYRLLRRIAKGGMGAIYEAEHAAIGKRVAIKLITSTADPNSEVARRFQQEATITSNLSNPHIVRVFDAGHDARYGFFMVMEMLHGEDLSTRIHSQSRLLPRDACEIVYQAARGLEKAHQAKIIHRDLKPSNVFLVDTGDGEFFVKVLDFGIAKAMDERERSHVHTRVGSTVGTPQYMSPEQAAGLDVLDERTDVFSLGSVLYEALVGEPSVPALGNYNQLVIRIATVSAPRVSVKCPDIDPRIDAVVADMMRRDRDARISSMREVRHRLGEILGKRDLSARWIAARPAMDSAVASVTTPTADESQEVEGGVEVFERPSMKRPIAQPVSPEPMQEPEEDAEPAAMFDRKSLKLPVLPADPSDGEATDVEIPIEFDDEA
jgi:serine/threonine-protein kinase